MKKIITFSRSIYEALDYCLSKQKKIILMGLGVNDPKGVFNTTTNLYKKHKNKVYDLPVAENGFTGIGLGLSIRKYRVVITHQRVEFSLLSFEQIINQIAKWFFMSAGKVSIPIVIRLIIGKGWGQGPQHSQSLESLFSHIPGLKVVAPSNAHDAKGMMISSIEDVNPVIFFEHRWLHDTKSKVPKGNFRTNLNKAKIIKKGKDITIISFSYSVIEMIKANNFLKKNKYPIDAELIDLRSLRPIDKETILKSVKKTKKVLVIDNGMITCGISAEILSIISENLNERIICKRIGVKDMPIPSSRYLADGLYPEYDIILQEVLKIFNIKKNLKFKKNL